MQIWAIDMLKFEVFQTAKLDSPNYHPIQKHS